jgi:hypothetical protein
MLAHTSDGRGGLAHTSRPSALPAARPSPTAATRATSLAQRLPSHLRPTPPPMTGRSLRASLLATAARAVMATKSCSRYSPPHYRLHSAITKKERSPAHATRRLELVRAIAGSSSLRAPASAPAWAKISRRLALPSPPSIATPAAQSRHGGRCCGRSAATGPAGLSAPGVRAPPRHFHSIAGGGACFKPRGVLHTRSPQAMKGAGRWARRSMRWC